MRGILHLEDWRGTQNIQPIMQKCVEADPKCMGLSRWLVDLNAMLMPLFSLGKILLVLRSVFGIINGILFFTKQNSWRL